MGTLFFLLAPLVYVAIIAVSALIVWNQMPRRRGGRNTDIGPLAAFLAGWVVSVFVAVLVQEGSLTMPNLPDSNTLILLSGFIGLMVGMAYLFLAKMVIGNSVMTSLFVFGSVGSSLISLLFYFTYEQVQLALLSVGVGFLLGVLLYVALFESRGGPGGLQESWRNLTRGRR